MDTAFIVYDLNLKSHNPVSLFTQPEALNKWLDAYLKKNHAANLVGYEMPFNPEQLHPDFLCGQAATVPCIREEFNGDGPEDYLNIALAAFTKEAAYKKWRKDLEQHHPDTVLFVLSMYVNPPPG